MYRIFGFFIAITLILANHISLYAAGCEINTDLPSSSEMRSSVDQCIVARKSGNPSSITDFVCPQGDFFAINQQPITSETVSMIVGIQLSLNKIDKDIEKYMKTLQKTREANPVAWVESINSCTEKIVTAYRQICAFGTIEARLNEDREKPYIVTTNTYPQTLCTNLTDKKIAGWKYLQNMMMSAGISKNQKNSTDIWINGVKGKYSIVLGSWHSYQKILARAVAKMTGYTKESN